MTQRNNYPILWIKDNVHFDTLFKKPVPVFVMCDSDKLVSSLLHANGAFTKSAFDMFLLTPNDRKVFDYNYIVNADYKKVLKELETHFFKLCSYKQKHAFIINRALKQAWRESKLELTVVNKMVDNNSVFTDTTHWSIEFPDKINVGFSTIDEELGVCGWIWSCKILHTVCTSNVLSSPFSETTEYVGFGTSPYEARVKDSVRMLREAATVLSYLTMHGSKEMFARFERTDPMFFKAYVCFAYQKLAEGLAYVLQANALIYDSRGSNLAPEAVEYLKMAYTVIESGYGILKNGKNGADDMGFDLPLAYNYIRVWVFVYYKFYHARLLAVTTSLLKICYKFMLKTLEFRHVAENKAALGELYNEVVGFDEKIESESTLSYFTSAIAKVIMPNNSNSFDKENIALHEINTKLEQMPDYEFDEDLIKKFKIPTVDQFLFRILT